MISLINSSPSKLLICGVILFLLGVSVTNGFLPANVPTIDGYILIKWLLKASIRDAGLILIISYVLITNICAVMKNNKVYRWVSIILSYLVCIVLVALYCINYVKYNKTYNDITIDKFSNKFKLALSEKISDKDKAKYEDLLAQVYYLKHNVFIEVRDASGNKSIYHPTPELVETKKINDKAVYLLSWIITRTIYSAIIWLLVPMVSSLYAVWSVKRRNLHGKRVG
jgi:Ca2+/Na+ antiporter